MTKRKKIDIKNSTAVIYRAALNILQTNLINL